MSFIHVRFIPLHKLVARFAEDGKAALNPKEPPIVILFSDKRSEGIKGGFVREEDRDKHTGGGSAGVPIAHGGQGCNPHGPKTAHVGPNGLLSTAPQGRFASYEELVKHFPEAQAAALTRMKIALRSELRSDLLKQIDQEKHLATLAKKAERKQVFARCKRIASGVVVVACLLGAGFVFGMLAVA